MEQIELIGKNIKILRGKLSLKQVALAKRIGISNTYLSDIESGRVYPSLHTLQDIAMALHIDIVTLITELPSEIDII